MTAVPSDPAPALSAAAAFRRITMGDRLAPSLEVIDGAFVAPQSEVSHQTIPGGGWDGGVWKGHVYDGGVYRPDGSVCEAARHNASSNENVPGAVVLAGARPLPGTWLYAGLLRGHFGHFLVESISRLWGVEAAGETVAGIIFNPLHSKFGKPRHPNANYKLASYVHDFLKILGITQPILMPTEIRRVERLVVPGQLLMNSPFQGVEGHPVLRAFLAARFDVALGPAPAAPSTSIYVSRRRLSPLSGIYMQEEVVEQNLAANGYDIVYPETLSVFDQMALYRQCRRIVLAEGSAGHMIALTANPAQRIGVIRRHLERRPTQTPKFERQIRAFGGGDTRSLAAVASYRKLSAFGIEGRYAASPIATLDLARLGESLREAGLIDGPWPVPDAAQQQAAVAACIDTIRELVAREELAITRAQAAAKAAAGRVAGAKPLA